MKTNARPKARVIIQPQTDDEERCFGAALRHPVGDLGDLQLRIDLGLNTLELPLLLQRPNE